MAKRNPFRFTWRDHVRRWWYRWRPYEDSYTRHGRRRVWATPAGYAELLWHRLGCWLGWVPHAKNDALGPENAFYARHPQWAKNRENDRRTIRELQAVQDKRNEQAERLLRYRNG